jgi:carbamoyl-phosphate synthase large subunit
MTYDTAIKWIGDHDASSEMRIDLVLNVPEMANSKENDSFPVRRKAVERGIPTMTCMDTAKAFLEVIRLEQEGAELQYAQLG